MATPWKHPRTGVYWFRKAVPARLRPAMGREFKRTLDTKDPEEAKRRFPRAALAYEEARRKAEGALGSAPDLDQLARQFVHDNAKTETEWEEVLFASRIETDWRLPADEDGEEPQVSEIALPFLIQMFGAEAVERDELAVRRAAWSAIQSELDSAHTMEDALNGWLRERKPAHKTELDWRTAVKEFGPKRYVGAATKQDVVVYKDRMIGQELAAGTIKKKITALRSLFGYAIEQGWRKDNPTDGVKVREGKVQKQTRIAYGPKHLKTIFAGPVHADGERPLGGGGEAAYWLPLLALYTGARLEELGQLRKEDVAKEQGIWRLEITDIEDGQSVKTVGSRRKVPLHRDIQKAFVAYVNKMPGGPLFPDLQHDNKGRVTGNWSKWWGRYQRGELGIDDPRLVFHSFRRTFKTLCEAAEIPERIHDALTGHTSKSVGRSYVDNNLATLSKYVAKIVVPLRQMHK